MELFTWFGIFVSSLLTIAFLMFVISLFIDTARDNVEKLFISLIIIVVMAVSVLSFVGVAFYHDPEQFGYTKIIEENSED